jgi:hypothetical protein
MSQYIDMCFDLSDQLINNFLSKNITGDKRWCFQYDSYSKQPNLQWKQPMCPQTKEVFMLKSQMKTMLITFFDIKDIVHFEFIP